MRKTLVTLAAGASLLGLPALAQPAGDTVAPADSAVGQTVDATGLTLATREQVRAGAEVTDIAGNSIGTVQGVDGEIAIVVRDGTLYDVPLSSLQQDATGKTHRLVTTLAPDEIRARTTASTESGGAAR